MAKIDSKSTGGGGFTFEDEVCAYFMSFMLSAVDALPGLTLGRMVKIKLQRKVDGWELDDLILEFERNGVRRSCAFSIKSNSQISANKIPDDLVSSLWNQFGKTEQNPFRPEHDYLGLVTSGASTAAQNSLKNLTKLAKNHGGTDLGIHINQSGFTNENVRALFSSFSKPADISCDGGIDQADIISRFLHHDLELSQPTSPYLIRAFENLSSVLISGEAKDLWDDLQNIARQKRGVSGEIGFSDIVDSLRDKFRFKEQREFSSDLIKLKEQKDIEIKKIKSTIGSELFIERSLDFSSKFGRDQINVFIGESGVGKSNLIKQWTLKSETPTVWLNHLLFNRLRSLVELKDLLGIDNDLFDIIQYGPSDQIVVIDGAEKISSHGSRDLLKSFLLKFQKISNGRHLCIICSQSRIWPILAEDLSIPDIPFNVTEAPFFGDSELKKISQNYPQIGGLLNSERAKEILKNPKYIDLAVQMIEESQFDTTKILSEMVLIDGFWQSLSQAGASPEKQILLQGLAVRQADEYFFATPLSSYSIAEVEIFKTLEREGFVKFEDSKVMFAHDLYGDWARSKFLFSKNPEDLKKEILKRKDNVFWNEAFRLFSLNLLQKDGFSKWKETVLSLKNSGEDLIADIFLDIAITSSNQEHILDTIRDLLFSDDCRYLSRFLKRFLAYATIPDPNIMSRRKEFELSETEATQLYRIPLYSYWPGLLLFLSKNLNVITGDRSQAALVAEKWLLFTPNNTPFRNEAAKIALGFAKWVFQLRYGEERTYIGDDIEEICYRSMLVAYPDLSTQVEDMSLKLIGIHHHDLNKESKRDGTSEPSLTNDPEIMARKMAAMAVERPTRKRIEKKPWPHGSNYKKDHVFQSIVLKNSNFNRLIKENPPLASKILLAAIIENPVEWEDIYPLPPSIFDDDNFGITDFEYGFYLPSYIQGPFLSFFRMEPDIALKTLITLIDFATARWEESVLRNGVERTEHEMKIGDESKIWKGDLKVFAWSLAPPIIYKKCPSVLVSFLMAFEKWLCDQIEAGEDIETWIDEVLNQSNSVALIGTLVSIAKKYPRLFFGNLKALLIQPHIILWDQQIVYQYSLLPQDVIVKNAATEFFDLEYGKIPLEQFALHFLLNVPNMSNLFSEARSSWLNDLDKGYDPNLHELTCRFDLNNYKEKKLKDGTSGWIYNPPDSFLQSNKKHIEENKIVQSRLLFPYDIIQLLDNDSFTAEDIESLEKRAEAIAKSSKENDDASLVSTEECTLSLDALKLLAHKRKLLNLSDEEIQKLKSKIFNVFEELWTDMHQYHGPEPRYSLILARVSGCLCVNEENDLWTRSLVGYIVCGFGKDALNSFTETMVRQGVDNKFLLTVIRLSFELCKMQSEWNSIHRICQFEEKKKNTLKDLICRIAFIRKKIFKRYTFEDRTEIYYESISKLLSNFVEGKIEPKWPSWKSPQKPYGFSRNFSFPKYHKNVINLARFIAVVSGLPSVNQWPDMLKNGWISSCSEGLDQITTRLRKSIENSGRIESAPHEQDTWMMKIFAETLLFNDDPRLAEALKSFFSIGPQGHYWFDDIGRHMFRVGLENPENWDMLAEKINFLFSVGESIAWLKQDSARADDVWLSFAGLDDLSIHLFSAESENLIEVLFPVYLKLFSLRPSFLRCLRPFTYLMRERASNEVRLQSLAIVAKAIKDKNLSSDLREDSLSLLSSYITKIWDESRIDLLSGTNHIDFFREILNSLVTAQDPRALEISRQLASFRTHS